MEWKKIARDRKRFVILEDVMFSWLLFGFTSLDQSIHFVLLCKERNDSAYKDLPLSTRTDSHWAPEEDIKQVSLFGNHLSICSVAPWLCILPCDYSTTATFFSDLTAHNCTANLFQMFLSTLEISSLKWNDHTQDEWHCKGTTSAIK